MERLLKFGGGACSGERGGLPLISRLVERVGDHLIRVAWLTRGWCTQGKNVVNQALIYELNCSRESCSK